MICFHIMIVKCNDKLSGGQSRMDYPETLSILGIIIVRISVNKFPRFNMALEIIIDKWFCIISPIENDSIWKSYQREWVHFYVENCGCDCSTAIRAYNSLPLLYVKAYISYILFLYKAVILLSYSAFGSPSLLEHIVTFRMFPLSTECY